MSNITYQKMLADEVLNLIYPISQHSIVAGGAPCNWYFDKEANDIDVFFYRPDLNTSHSVKSTFESVGLQLFSIEMPDRPTDDNLNGNQTYFLNPLVESVYDCQYGGQKFQFIQMRAKTFQSVVPHFPLNMSRIWYKNKQIQLTNDFAQGIKCQALIKLDELYADGNKYVKKIQAKFPHYTYYSSLKSFYQHQYGA